MRRREGGVDGVVLVPAQMASASSEDGGNQRLRASTLRSVLNL